MTAALKQLRSEVGPDSFIISDGPIPMAGKNAFMYQVHPISTSLTPYKFGKSKREEGALLPIDNSIFQWGKVQPLLLDYPNKKLFIFEMS